MLVLDTMSEIRAKQEKLDRDLREHLLLSAVRFKPSEFEKFEPPSPAALERYRARQAEVERAAKLLRLPLTEVQQSLQEFFDKMSELSGELEPSGERQSRRPSATSSRNPDRTASALMAWLINKSQVGRILENLEQFEAYAKEREALHDPINRLLELLNKFLAQSNKRVEITETDRLHVRLPDDRCRGTVALSSGERQLLVMLGHLALGRECRRATNLCDALPCDYSR
jgi:hypothetical protein